MASDAKWLRVRFYADGIYNDPRPLVFPPPGPWWCTGCHGDDTAVIVAYVRSTEQILEHWPEARDLDIEEAEDIIYSDRFPKPEWWAEEERKQADAE